MLPFVNIVIRGWDFLSMGWLQDWMLFNRRTPKVRFFVALLWVSLIPAIAVELLTPMRYSSNGVTHWLLMGVMAIAILRITTWMEATIAYRCMAFLYSWFFGICLYQWIIVGMYTQVTSFSF